ncbi:hypothetical protein [Abyssisolibacter fermentans]|uniref:hypothetical protein n=1 Tax=Abyssisolibacter fermentans TaxID=1766203 RepID=UPI0008328FCB|nr:hypothetical protein [Abyssisolibacter fermentans]
MSKYCMMVRDLIDYYGIEGLEGETLAWVKGHISACDECKNYIPDEKAKKLMTEVDVLSEKDKKLIKKVRLVFYLGCSFVGVFLLWISLWSILWSK